VQALLVVDAQNEFSSLGLRSVPNHEDAIEKIRHHVARQRREERPIAWVKHHNKPSESPAFVPGSWGAELTHGFGPPVGSAMERLFVKDVFGAFTGTNLEAWLRTSGVDEVLITGFYSHMCVSTSAREALVRGFEVFIDADATGATSVTSKLLGTQSADQVRASALLHLQHMGVHVFRDVNGSATGAGGSDPLLKQSA
jgi:nicotinamidase-related amidase